MWFHGTPDDSEVGLDAAKYVGHRLGAELRLAEVGKTSVLMSDKQMYRSGFAVLRHAEVPAFLVEASFFTEPREEQRLRDAAYNLREAYAIYLGLVEYAYGGRPTQSTPRLTRDGAELVLQTTLDEGLPDWWGHDKPRILRSSVAVFVDGTRVPCASTRRASSSKPASPPPTTRNASRSACTTPTSTSTTTGRSATRCLRGQANKAGPACLRGQAR